MTTKIVQELCDWLEAQIHSKKIQDDKNRWRSLLSVYAKEVSLYSVVARCRLYSAARHSALLPRVTAALRDSPPNNIEDRAKFSPSYILCVTLVEIAAEVCNNKRPKGRKPLRLMPMIGNSIEQKVMGGMKAASAHDDNVTV